MLLAVLCRAGITPRHSRNYAATVAVVRHAGANATPVVGRAGAGNARQVVRGWCWYAARPALVRCAPGFGTPRRWRRYSVCVSDANFHPARAMSDVSKHNRMEFVDFPPSLFSPLSLCTKLLLPVSPLCLPARWGKILNIHQMMQVILVLRDFFFKIHLNSSILRVAFYLS